MYEIEVMGPAQAFFDEADAALQRRLDRSFRQLKTEPRRHHNIKKLRGRHMGSYRYRVGDYRVVYVISDAERIVRVTTIAHRREVYD